MALFVQASVAAHECSIGLGCGDLGSRVRARGSRCSKLQVAARVINQICFSSVLVTESTGAISQERQQVSASWRGQTQRKHLTVSHSWHQLLSQAVSNQAPQWAPLHTWSPPVVCHQASKYPKYLQQRANPTHQCFSPYAFVRQGKSNCLCQRSS